MSTSSVFPALRKLDTSAADKASSSSRPTGSVKGRPSLSSTLADTVGLPLADRSSKSDPALLNFKFTGPSFLDVVVKDDHTKTPVYIIETIRDSTSLYRLDGETRKAEKVSTVQWPPSASKGKGKTGRTVQIGEGRWRDTEEFLKYGALANYANRKFNVPRFPHALKWKLVPGNSYYCSTSGIKGPIAVLDAAVLSAPPRLRIFDTSLNGDGDRVQKCYRGVPVMLLDYLMTTALLLVTEVQEWLDRPQTDDGRVRIPGSSAPAVQKWLAVIHGEPPPDDKGKGPDWDTRSAVSGASGSAAGSSAADSTILPTMSSSSSSRSAHARVEQDVPPVPALPTRDGKRRPLPVALHTPPSSSASVPAPHPYSAAALALSDTSLTSSSSSSSPSPLPFLTPSTPPGRTMSSIPNSPAGPRPLPKPPGTPGSASGSAASGVPRSWMSDLYSPMHSPSFSTTAQASIGSMSRPGSPSDQSIASSSASVVITEAHRVAAVRPLVVANRDLPVSVSMSMSSSQQPQEAETNASDPSASLPSLPAKLAHELAGSQYERSVNAAAAAANEAYAGSQPHQWSEPQMQAQTHAQAIAESYGSREVSHVSQPQLEHPQPHTFMHQMTHEMNSLHLTPPSTSRQPTPSPASASSSMLDVGQIDMAEARRRASYAETIYEQPPPAYDAIDFSLPQVPLPAHARMQQ